MSTKLETAVKGFLAGFLIALGGVAYLSIDNKVVGALFFTLGLFAIMTNGFNLFTGKVAYVFEKDGAYAVKLLIIWASNFIGAALGGFLMTLTRHEGLITKAADIAAVKLGDGLLSVFILAVLCNMLIFVAVDGYNNNPHQIGKYLAMIFGVSGFIVCGFEHCIANIFYFTLAGAWSGKAFLYIIVMTLGNSVGGVIIPLMRKIGVKETVGV